MTCDAVHVRRGPTGYALEEIRCLSHDGRFHVGVATFGRYTWRPEDDPAERARRHLAASPFFPGVNDSNAAEVLARTTSKQRGAA